MLIYDGDIETEKSQLATIQKPSPSLFLFMRQHFVFSKLHLTELSEETTMATKVSP
ncbi:hypothetical protein [Desulfobacter sp.]|uniref:hypothetical protein n=1 Tax=Desulfobacter sp. TaxID=2294 RepID=UPI003D144B18